MKRQDNWFKFAQEDLIVAKSALDEEVYNQVCFHSQQGVEKTLKGFLKRKNKNIPRSHNLKELLEMCIDTDAEFKIFKNQCISLDRYYIFTRYPDAVPGALSEGMPVEDDAKEALSALKNIIDFVKDKIGQQET